jgi:hypothetical protein
MKYLVSYKLFEEKNYEFGCVMIDIPVENWNEITQFIDKDDIYSVEKDDTYGLQDRPHITLLYGMHKDVTIEMIKPIFKEIEPFDIEIDGIDIFENNDYDVVKFNVKRNPNLDLIFNRLSKLPNSNKFKDYKPHITISYVKSGSGKKYINRNYNWVVNGVNTIIYSTCKGNEYKINLNELNEGIEQKFKYTTNDGHVLYYDDDEWKIPNSEVRNSLETDINEILLELNDLGYVHRIGGFQEFSDSPYIWIVNKKDNKRQKLNLEEIEDFVKRINYYLKLNGFETEIRIINKGLKREQLFLFFGKKN